MQFIDDAEFQVAIDLDQGARIASIKWRDIEFAMPFRGGNLNWGWYAMAPWAGRIRDGIIRNPAGKNFNCQQHLIHPMQFMDLDQHRHGKKLVQDVPCCIFQNHMAVQLLNKQLKYSMMQFAGLLNTTQVIATYLHGLVFIHVFLAI